MVSVFLMAGLALQAHAAVTLKSLQVEYRPTPLGIDVARPRFGWQMEATSSERGLTQKAYQLVVKDAKGTVVWDTKRVADGASLGIVYAGSPLQASTRYAWTVTVWPAKGGTLSATSWFETGLMDPSPSLKAWGGAQWIGGGNADLVLHAPYLAIFDLQYSLAIAPDSVRAGFVYGANDSRLMDRNKNIYQVQNAKDRSYIKLVLDIAAVNGTPEGKAKLHVYRAGYKDTDSAELPLKT
jgi:alpha-L-rhamnosidase